MRIDLCIRAQKTLLIQGKIRLFGKQKSKKQNW